MKYGVKVYWPDGEFLWVTEGDSKFQITPKLFESRVEAEEYALSVWGDSAIVEEYGENKDSN
jgi:hypothetical protein